MARTVIDIDDRALAAAAQELGTTTKVETVNAALREIASRRLRMAFVEQAAAGSFAHLADPAERDKAVALVEFLADTSVLTRLRAPAIRDRVGGLVRAGSIALCAVGVAEVLRGTRSPEHHRETREQLQAFFWLPTPDDVWDRLIEVQAALAERGLRQCVKIPDLLIAAVAERHRVTVLHDDRDFDAIAEVTDQACEWVVTRGSAP